MIARGPCPRLPNGPRAAPMPLDAFDTLNRVYQDVAAVCDGCTAVQIAGESRIAPVAYARHLCYYVLTTYERWSNSAIARVVGVDRSSVRHGVRRIRALLDDENDDCGWTRQRLERISTSTARRKAERPSQS